MTDIMGELVARTEGHSQCLLGFHAWVPWLEVRNDDGSLRFYQTWCAREDCDHIEQWDAP